MNRLIIDGADKGEYIGYRQNRERRQWVFLMKDGYFISIDWASIKLFDSSSGNAVIILFH